MRKHLLLAGGLAAALLLAACGEDTGADPNRELKLGIVVANNSLNFAREMYEGATEAAKHAGNIDFKVAGPTTTDGPAEVQLFENLTVTSPDGIIVENLAPPLFTRPEARAVDKGIPIVALDTSPMDGSKVNFYVGNDNYELGALLAKETLKRLGNDAKGLVVIGVPNPGTPVLDNRAQGIEDTFNQQAPGIKVLGPFQTYSDPAQNYNAWLAQVHAHPDALAFLGVGDADSYDLAKIKDKEHGKYLTAGFDVDPKTLQAIKKGTNFVGLDPAHFLKGYLASAVLAERAKAGQELPKGWFKTPGIVIDQSNIDEIIQRQKSPREAYRWYKPQIDELLDGYEGRLKPLQDAR